MFKRSWFVVLILVALTWGVTLPAQGPDPAAGEPSLDLLDRGSLAAEKLELDTKTHTTPMLMTAVLSNGGPPTVTMAPLFLGPGPLLPGYFFIAPVDFPLSYHPFFVTGAYAFLGGSMGYFGTPMLGVAVAPAAPTPMVMGSFVLSLPMVAPMGTPGVGTVFSGMFPHTPPIGVPMGSGVFCGGGGLGLGGLGGLTPGTGGGKPLVGLSPGMSSLAGFPAPPATYVVGCFISGATVPVELQSFHVD